MALGAVIVAGALAIAGGAQAALVQIIGPEANGTFAGNDCGAGGFSDCYATQTGTQQGAPTNPALLGSAAVYKRDSVNNQPTGSEDFGTGIPNTFGTRFTISYNGATNEISFSYAPQAGDPILHYFSVKQSDGFVLFYDASPIIGATVDLDTYFPNNPGWSHITFFNGGTVPAPEPASLALFGAGLLGLALHRRRRPTG